MPAEQHYWFPAKRHGWGWGRPTAWQGWAVLLAFIALVGVGTFHVLPTHGSAALWAYLAVLTVLLLGICRTKGEPTRWRWGDK